MTEPDGGTDILSAMKTVARQDGEEDVINGAKIYTTGLNFAFHVFVVARTGNDASKPSFGLTVFLLPANTPGITFRKTAAGMPFLTR